MADPSEGYLSGPAGDVFVRGENAYFFDRDGKVSSVPRANIGVALDAGLTPMTHSQVYEHDRIYEQERQAQTMGGQMQAAVEGAARSAADTLLAIPRAAAAVTGIDQKYIPKGGDLVANFMREAHPEMTRAQVEEQLRLRADTTGGHIGTILPDLATIPLGIGAAKGLGTASTLGRVAITQAVPGAFSGAQLTAEDAWRRNTEVDPTDLMVNMGMGALISGGLGTVGHYGGNLIQRGTGAALDLAKGGGASALRTSSRVLKAASQYSDLVTAPGTFRGARGLVTGKLAALLESAAELSGRGARTAERAAQSGTVRALGREVTAAEQMASRAAIAEERLAANAARAEERLTANIAGVDESLAGRAAKLQSAFEDETARVAKASAKEAQAANREVAKHSANLARAQQAMDRSASEAIPAISAAEARLAKATARESALVKRGSSVPRDQLQAARKEVAARKYALEGVQEKYASIERGHANRVRLARDGIEEAKARAQAAKDAVTSGAEQRQARLAESLKAEQEAANIKRQALLDKRDTLRTELANARTVSQDAQRAAGLTAQRARVRMDAALAEATAPRPQSGIQKALAGALRPVGAGTESWARVGFRPYPLTYAESRLGDAYDAHTDSPSKQFAQQQRDTKALMDKAIQTAASSSGRWTPISGVGNYRDYPSGQFMYPNETRRQAFYARQKELAEMLTNPAGVIEKLGTGVGADLASMSPQAYQQVSLTVMRALDWLGRFQYGSASQADPFKPHNTKAPISDSDIAQFERLWNATMFPGVLTDQIAQWRLDRDTITTAANVHPEMLNGVRAAVSNAIISGAMKPTYQQRIQLSELFGLPIPETLPQTQAMLQMATAQQAQKEAATPARAPGRPTGSPTLSQQYRTVSQQAANPGT